MKTISVFLCLLMGISVFAKEITISGRVIDNETTETLAYASIALSKAQAGGLVSGTVSDEDGRFKLSILSSGNYVLNVSFVGYESYSEDVLIGELNTNFDLGKIALEQTAKSIGEVTIKAQKSAMSAGMEKKLFEMDDNIAQSGGSVLDAMKAMPGITVDQDGKVILRGSDKVVVLIDGKQSSLTGFGNQKGLDNIPVANVEKIEIINNPSAKYDAAGMAGIINIIYKKEKENGFNGDVGFAYGLGALSKPKADLPTDLGSYSVNPKYIPSANFNYRKDKINVFAQSEALSLNKLPNNEFTTRYYDDGRITASQVPENRTQQHYILKGGIDYFMDENNTFSVSAIYDWESHVDTAQVPYIDMNTGKPYRHIAWNEEEVTGYMNYAVNFKHTFAQVGHELDIRAQYTKGWEDETYYINDSSAIRQGRDITNILATEHTTFLQADYTKPLRSGRFEGGAKFQIRSLPVDYTVQRGEKSVIYPGLGEWSKWGEDIYAAYGNYVYERPVFDIEAGLRAEYTDVYYDMDPASMYYDENDEYNYFEFFPNVRLSYKMNAKNKVSLFYNRRVDRPGEPELRIFPKSDDQELLKMGNPYLRPQFTQSFEAAYKTKWETGSVYLSAYYRLIDNPFMRVYTSDNNNPSYDVILKSYANTGSATNGGLELVFSQQLFDFWKISGNANYYRNEIAAYQGRLLFPYEHSFSIKNTSENTWDAKLNNQFSFSKALSMQLTAVYLAAKNIPQGRQDSRSSIDVGVKKKVFDSKGEISFSASDIFNTYGIRQTVDGDGFRATYENYYETQVLRIGFKYKF